MTLRPHAGMGGFSWGVAGFLLGVGDASITDADKQRVADEIKTTFATTYSRRLSLEQMLDPAMMVEYQKQQSNNKALVVPHLGSGGGGASAKL
jgi:NADPH2:quinone reductase